MADAKLPGGVVRHRVRHQAEGDARLGSEQSRLATRAAAAAAAAAASDSSIYNASLVTTASDDTAAYTADDSDALAG